MSVTESDDDEVVLATQPAPPDTVVNGTKFSLDFELPDFGRCQSLTHNNEIIEGTVDNHQSDKTKDAEKSNDDDNGDDVEEDNDHHEKHDDEDDADFYDADDEAAKVNLQLVDVCDTDLPEESLSPLLDDDLMDFLDSEDNISSEDEGDDTDVFGQEQHDTKSQKIDLNTIFEHAEPTTRTLVNCAKSLHYESLPRIIKAIELGKQNALSSISLLVADIPASRRVHVMVKMREKVIQRYESVCAETGRSLLHLAMLEGCADDIRSLPLRHRSEIDNRQQLKESRKISRCRRFTDVAIAVFGVVVLQALIS
jgi:hypothetical protein